MGAKVGSDFRLLQSPIAASNGRLESSWFGAVRFQPNLGIAAPLSGRVWLMVAKHVSDRRGADTGILGIHDAFADYMAGRDEKCILNLCITIEILLNKHRQVVLKKPANENLDKIIRTTPLIDDSTKGILKNCLLIEIT